ncbi:MULTISPECIES: hypothetical protein [unclassified Moorena]|uniref:hypothetical protein n=1 Tax=unclassified Moorena TaxID=2683338 RepID=UPI0025E76C9B|nr:MULTISPECIES: hypothetical protein [unclassified Moorena]
MDSLFSGSPLSKARRKKTSENLPVHSFSTLMADLGTITLNTITAKLEGNSLTFSKVTQPTQVQQKALDLLNVSLFVPSK